MTHRTSTKRDTLVQKRDALKLKAKASHNDVIRLSKARYPTQWYDSTVVRVTDVDAPEAAFLGFKPQRNQAGVKAIGTSDEDDAAHKQEVLRRVLAGETIVNEPTITETLEKAQSDWAAYEAGIDFVNKEIAAEDNILADQYAKSFKGTHDKHMTALCASALDFYAKYAEAYDGKRHLIDSGVGLRDGMYHNLPESFLSAPDNPWSDMAAWFTEAKRQGFIREVPQSLRMKVAK